MAVRPPRKLGRYLEDEKLYPVEREDFAMGWRAARLEGEAWDGDAGPGTAILCGVPRGIARERITETDQFDDWLNPSDRLYTPPGIWMPFRDGDAGRRYASGGFLRTETNSSLDLWRRYLFVGRDGYVEAGQRASFNSDGKRHYYFAPLVAWVERFSGLLLDLQKLMNGPNYWIVLSIPNTSGSRLAVFGHGWADYNDLYWRLTDAPKALERHIQVNREVQAEAEPQEVSSWFATRIANAFGFRESRCYNRQESSAAGPVGSLPRNRVDIW